MTSFLRSKMRGHTETQWAKVIQRVAARHRIEPPGKHDGGGSSFEQACRVYRIRTKAEGLVTFDPARWYDEQRRFAAERTGRDLVVKSRQIGLTTPELLRGYHQATTRESWNVRVVIHDSGLADDLFQTVHLAHESMHDSGRVALPRLQRVRELFFAELASGISVQESGASMIAAQKKGRSGTTHRLHATEVAFWRYARETMTGLLGSVPDGGEVLIESTTNGPQGFFYEEVQRALAGESEYQLHFFPWWQHQAYRVDALPDDFDASPRDDWEQKLRQHGCDDAQIEWWRRQVGRLTLEKALQEYPESIETCFRSSGDGWFPAEVLDAAAAHIREPLRQVDVIANGRRLGTLLVFAEPHEARRYLGGADVSEGIGADGHGASFLDARTAEVVATFWSDSIEPGDYAHALAFAGRLFNNAELAVERNNNGHATLRALGAECHYPNIYHWHDGRPGWVTSPVSRPIMWDEGWTAVRDGHLRTPDTATLGEMRTLTRDERGRPAARNKSAADGAKDDRWTGLIIAWQVFQASRVGGGVVSGVSLGAEADSLTSIM